MIEQGESKGLEKNQLAPNLEKKIHWHPIFDFFDKHPNAHIWEQFGILTAFLEENVTFNTRFTFFKIG